MYAQDINQNIAPKYNTYSTLTPLNSILKIFGLYCISIDGKKIKYSWPLWKVAFTTPIFFILNSIIIYYAFLAIKTRFQNYFVLLYILAYIQYYVDLILVYKYGRQRCLDYYNIFENIDRVIGMPYYNEIKKSISNTCHLFTLVCFCYFLSDVFPIVIAHGWIIAAFHTVDYIYIILKVLSSLDGIAHFTQIKFRLKRIKDILRHYYITVANLPGVTNNVVFKKNWSKNIFIHNRLDALSMIGYRSEVILYLSKCYLLLLEQCDYINGMFGFRILFGGFIFLLEMVMLTNLMIRLIMGTMIPFYQSLLISLLPNVLKVVIYSLILLCGINCCEHTYKQTDRIIRCVDHMLTNKKLTPKARGALKELRGLIISRPISFCAVNFYKLDYPTMLTIASAVVTYSIILLQNI